jgi:hypothetical protein
MEGIEGAAGLFVLHLILKKIVGNDAILCRHERAREFAG